jgi:hypothetical protein
MEERVAALEQRVARLEAALRSAGEGLMTSTYSAGIAWDAETNNGHFTDLSVPVDDVLPGSASRPTEAT